MDKKCCCGGTRRRRRRGLFFAAAFEAFIQRERRVWWVRLVSQSWMQRQQAEAAWDRLRSSGIMRSSRTTRARRKRAATPISSIYCNPHRSSMKSPEACRCPKLTSFPSHSFPSFLSRVVLTCFLILCCCSVFFSPLPSLWVCFLSWVLLVWGY